MIPIEQKWILDIQAWAAGEPLIREIYLFGSRIKGDHGDHSDLDMAVLTTGNSPGERDGNFICSAARWRKALSVIVPVKVDLQVAEPGSDKIVWPAVKDHGLKIYPKPSPRSESE